MLNTIRPPKTDIIMSMVNNSHPQITILWHIRDSPELVQSYLTDRVQYVEINSLSSTLGVITTGAPQGSILGPLLFLIYINDLPSVSKTFKFILFADDTNLLTTIEYFIPIQNSNESLLLNNELEKIHSWLSVNKLTLNIEKTKFMIFHPYQKDIYRLHI